MAKISRKTIICVALCFLARKKYIKKRKSRRWWVRPMYAERKAVGFYETTFQTLKEDSEMFAKATRMSVGNFDALLALTKDNLEKYSARKPIVAECRLALTLMFLAHGGSRFLYSLKFKISLSSVSAIINETIYMAPPGIEEWKRISLKYEENWQLPNCLGAIDGKHVSIVCPPNAESQFFNYKNRHSIVLLAACDANYSFTMVGIGAYGSQSDGGIFAQSSFGRLLNQGELQIPPPKPLPKTADVFPHYFVGDNAFPLSPNLMRPFPGVNIDRDQINFNKRFSRARVTIVRNDIHAFPNNVDNIIKASVILHNYLMLQKCSAYCPPNVLDTFENNYTMDNLPTNQEHNAPKAALNFRKKLCTYLKNN